MTTPIPSMTGGAGGAAGPSQASGAANTGGARFDNSGWNITFGSNSGIKATDSEPVTNQTQLIMLAAAFLLAWKLIKRS